MFKFKKGIIAGLALAATTALSACEFGKKDDHTGVVFWSSFGSKYTAILDGICNEISTELNIQIDHKSKGSYPSIRKDMVSSIATGTYPDIAVGYPDHFAQYHGSNILRTLDDYVTGDLLADYDPYYMTENYLYDKDGSKHLYGVPFNKSTELLGYNGVFVDYVAEINSDPSLKVLPKTWDEWASTDPNSKVQKYKAAFDGLVNSGSVLYGIQDEDGTAHDFALSKTVLSDKKKLIDYTNVDPNLSRLMSWDSQDNAFITLVRQWGAEYTGLPEDQHTVHPKIRQGQVLFGNSKNRPIVISMLKFFKDMSDRQIFTTPSTLGGSYSSDAFTEGRCMFMVCSSGGLSYNTGSWENRFRVAPIPYKSEDHKCVISQGANICMTKHGTADDSFAVMKALTTGKFQTEWAKETGYFPCSNSAQDSAEYKEFLNDTSYDNYTLVTYREGAVINQTEYRAKGWDRFVDEPFIGSAVVRELVANILGNAFKNVVNGTDAEYSAVLDAILDDSQISSNANIAVDKN